MYLCLCVLTLNRRSQGKRKEETFHILYKPHLFFAVEDEDLAGVDLMYQQVRRLTGPNGALSG